MLSDACNFLHPFWRRWRLLHYIIGLFPLLLLLLLLLFMLLLLPL
jgi:hypothetical protein